MTTSANVTHYYVYRGNERIGEFTQHHYCDCKVEQNLAAYKPLDHLEVIWPDEEEVPRVEFSGTVKAFLAQGDSP